MDDLREKVMTWLKICGVGDCSECCPYKNGEVRASTCYEQLMTDALSLLKEQQSAYERGKRDGVSQYLREREEDEEYEY